MQINSSKVKIDKPINDLFVQLSQVSTYKDLMPDSATFTQIDDHSFRFILKGMPEIGLKITERLSPTKVIMSADGGKVPFELRGTLQEISASETEVQLQFDGTMNRMMEMMAKKPLTNFLDVLVHNIQQL